MKSYEAFFVRTENSEQAKKIFRRIEPIEGSSWVMCGFDKDVYPEDSILFGEESATQAKSEKLGEIIYVYGDSSDAEGFIYEHACDGVLLRKLVWFMLEDGMNTGWVCVEGEAEKWEEALFRPDSLEQFVRLRRESLQDRGKNDQISEFEAEVQKIYDEKKIIVGKSFPVCDGTCAILVEKSYGIERGL